VVKLSSSESLVPEPPLLALSALGAAAAAARDDAAALLSAERKKARQVKADLAAAARRGRPGAVRH